MRRQRNILLTTAVAGLLAVAFAGRVCSTELTLAEDGHTSYVIVVADDAAAPDLTAAAELREYLDQITSSSFPVRKESEVDKPALRILVGQSATVKKLLPDVDWAGLGQEGIVIKTVGSDLVLAGGRPRGSLYAVYTFLEDVVGCRWWTPTESRIPRVRALTVSEQDTVYTPPFVYREAYYGNLQSDAKFAVRLKNNANGPWATIPPEYGGHYNMPGCHSFYSLLPPSVYFAQHPEWYSEINGVRVSQNAQLCLTNEEMRKEMVKAALARVKSTGSISISQNDCYGACQCAKCKALEEKEGSPSGPMIDFVNAIAAEIEKKYPDVLVDTLAYQYTRKPPRNIRPRKNVMVRLCTIECNFARPLDDETNKEFRDDIRNWGRISNVFVWDYVTNFANYQMPSSESLRPQAEPVVLSGEQRERCLRSGRHIFVLGRLRSYAAVGAVALDVGPVA